MFNIAEYRKEPERLADLLLWAGLIAPGLVLNKDGSLQKTLAFRGPDLDSSTQAELVASAYHLNNTLKRFGSGWGIFIGARRTESIVYPTAYWPEPVSALVDEERRAHFEDNTTHYETQYYITLSWFTPPQRLYALERLLYEHVPGKTAVKYAEAIDSFQEEFMRFEGLLSDCLPYVHALDSEETLTFLHSVVSTKHHTICVPEVPMYIDALLADSPLTGGVRPLLGDQFLRTLTIKAFPGESFPGILQRLLYLNFAYRYDIRYLALDREDAERLFGSYQRKWLSKRKALLAVVWEVISQHESPVENREAVTKAQEAALAQEDASSGTVSFGYFTATVSVWDKDHDTAEAKLRLVERAIHGCGFATHTEDLNAVEAWLGSHPGNTYANVRRPIVSSRNLSHLMPAQAVWAGPEKDAYWDAPPLLYAVTQGLTPFRVVLHENDVGHMEIYGPTGAGKTTLLGTMMLQFMRYHGAQVYVFDNGLGLRAVTRALGGTHYIVGGDHSAPAFQPLHDIGDNDDEKSWAAEWIEEILTLQNITLTPPHRSEIWRAILALGEMPCEQRTLTGLQHFVQHDDLRQALEPYTLAGAHGHLLDASQDTLDIHSTVCFEMGPIFETPRLVAPVLRNLSHRLEHQFTGRPTLLIFEEAGVALNHELFEDKIRDWLLTLRKANVCVIFVTQSLAQTAESKIAAIIQESCLTRIFLPNARAVEEHIAPLYRGYGLNDRQIHMLATATPQRDYYFDSPVGNRLFDLELGEATLALTGSGSKDDHQFMDTLPRDTSGPEFAAALLRYKGVHWAAAILDNGGASVHELEREQPVPA